VDSIRNILKAQLPSYWPIKIPSKSIQIVHKTLATLRAYAGLQPALNIILTDESLEINYELGLTVK